MVSEFPRKRYDSTRPRQGGSGIHAAARGGLVLRMSGTHVAETTSKITGYVIGAVKRVIPASAQPGANRLFDRTTNAVESVLGWREELTPPLRIRIHIGPFADPRLYRLAGDMNVEAFKDLAGLKPNASFLDIACGCGRVARALTKYLGRQRDVRRVRRGEEARGVGAERDHPEVPELPLPDRRHLQQEIQPAGKDGRIRASSSPTKTTRSTSRSQGRSTRTWSRTRSPTSSQRRSAS